VLRILTEEIVIESDPIKRYEENMEKLLQEWDSGTICEGL